MKLKLIKIYKNNGTYFLVPGRRMHALRHALKVVSKLDPVKALTAVRVLNGGGFRRGY